MSRSHQPDTFGDAPLAPPSPMAVLEMKMGLEPIETLLDERSRLIQQVSDLRAKYGSFGVWDHLRKIELSRLKTLVRLQAMRDKVKMNNDQVDDEAHAHSDYVEFVTLAARERAEWHRLEGKIAAIDYTINRAQVVGRYATAEVNLR